MKKVLGLIAVLVLGAAFAQNTDSVDHEVSIEIPSMIEIQFVDSLGAVVANPTIQFDYQADITGYLAAVNGGTGVLAPTSTADFANIQVRSNYDTWNVTVTAVEKAGTSLVGSGLALADIAVDNGVVGAGNISFAMGSGVAVTSGTRTLSGGSLVFEDLGISSADYSLAVDGDEDPGLYEITVTYTVTGI